jgi:hypothetical protein
MNQKTKTIPPTPKSSYQTPQLKRVGQLSKITLKMGSNSDAGMPRVM